MDFFSHSFLFLLLLFLLMCPSSFSFQNHPASFSSSWQCLDDERLALLQLKHGFSIYPFNHSASKLDSWNNDDDCCSWRGIECDEATGHVIQLNLSSSWISGRIDSSLFRLVALQRLNLFDSWFDGNPIPSGLDQLTNLTHLNLSLCDFVGQVPLEISRLNKLVSLDLSMNDGLKFEKPNFTTFLQNMSSSLEELYLSEIDISTQGNEWGQAISSSLPNLQKLSLSRCGLTVSAPLKIARLTKLVSLDLSNNWELLEKSDFTTLIKNLPNNLKELKLDEVNISQPGSKWGQVISSALPNLQKLSLSSCGLTGSVPLEIGGLAKLVSLDLSWNHDLKLEKSDFTTLIKNLPNNLRELKLDYVNISQPGAKWGQVISSALPNLQKLSLCECGLTGSVPFEITRLAKLVSLDLSENLDLKFEESDFTTLIKNLPNNLTELKLDYVNISQPGAKWGQVISSALPNLRMLGLRYCQLSGPIDPSLLHLHFLSTLDLSENNFSTEVPHFLSNFSYLTSLSLSDCGLYGKFPKTFFLLPSLQMLDVSYNPLLTIELPEFPQNSAFQRLILSDTRFPGKVPNSFSNLKYLKELDLANCNIHGPFPSWISNLTQLAILDLSNNNFTGPIPSSLLSHPSLQMIYLSNNKLHGPVPRVLFQLPMLFFLDISFNNFSGIQELQDLFQSLKNLSDHHLLDNSLNFTNSNDNSSYIFSYQIQYLSLRSCNITEFPNILKYLNNLYSLDLSNNEIHGEVPKWIWTLGNGTLSRLNLSNNFLESLEGPLHHNGFFELLDLHSNNFQGSLPILPSSFYHLDFSNNHFTSTIPANINLNSTGYLFLSNNNFSGHIPPSICHANNLKVLDLSNNRMSGTIPKCVEELSNSLVIISLQGNSFQGALPLAFTKNCSLRTLNLNGNQIEGPLPQSLANCKYLEVLDLGNNRINDAFPHWLGILSEFRVLILRSNKFHGPIVHPQTNQSLFPMLQIIDLSSNGFTGNLHSEFFQSLKAIRGLHDSQLMSQNQVLRYYFANTSGYYQDTVMVTIKGLDMRLERILSLFISIDFSNNKFDGEIPESIGGLKFIYGLNFSRNGFSGHIPTSLANLMHLESLDLSKNILSGEIPWQLTRLTFLEVLNLSYNLLEGSIPQSNQFSTFNNDSFLKNPRLCGPPLSRKCGSNETASPSSFAQTNDKQTREIDGKFMWIGFGLGYGIGLGTFFWVLALSKKVCREYMKLIDKMLEMVFH